MDALHLESWPAFFEGDAVMRRYWPRLADEFPHCQFLLVDEKDQAVAAGNALPIRWNGTPEDLPLGWDAGLERGFQEAERGEEANTLLMLTGVVDARAQGTGLSQIILNLFKAVARGYGFERVIVPVRPTGKSAHPELSFTQWCERRRPDGLAEDPWLRSHERVGGKVLRIELKSQRVEGSLEDWERWTGRTFPTSGEYALEGALQPLRMELESRTGVYEDPCVWMEHFFTGSLLAWQPVDGPALREFLRRSLPEYMVPEYYRVLGRMPLGDSGKVDEQALPRHLPGRALRARSLPPQTPVQERLVAIWKSVLELEQLGIEDDFFELGGHSIRAVRMLAKVADAFGISLSLRQLFTARSIEALAPLIEAAQQAGPARGG
jgi:acyl carrier protein